MENGKGVLEEAVVVGAELVAGSAEEDDVM